MSKVKGPKDISIGNIYMYRRWNYWSSKLEVGKCVKISEKIATFKDIEHPYLSDNEVDFIADRFEQEYSLIADYDKRIFNAYNKKIDDTCNELVNIWNGIDVVRRKKKRKKSWWKKLWR